MPKKINFTGDSDTDAPHLTAELDELTVNMGMSLTDYAEYLDDLSKELTYRAKQVRHEAR